MIVPYRERRYGGEVHHLPLITVTLESRKGAVEVNALIDSGAEHNVFNIDLADHLGLNYANGRPVELTTITGQTSGYLLAVRYALRRHRWHAPTIFTEAADQQGLLGQQGFFENFAVTFRYYRRDMSVRWAQHTMKSR